MIWQFARTASALLPIAIAWRLASGGPEDSRKRAVLFMSATMLTWMSLNQFPYAAPVYFCYVAPLAVIAAVAALDALPAIRWSAILPWAALLLIFAALSPNRSYLGWLGAEHSPIRFDEPLNLSRAHLNVGVERARAYRNLVASIRAHLHGGQLIAAPDCPEVYFLSGLTNPSGRLYDVLSNNVSDDAGPWLKGSVVVINHQPAFAANPSQVVVTTLRREFSHGERFGPFEIRWR
jgi:hypothetical protein